MPNPGQNARLKELVDSIEKEHDQDKFMKLIVELNAVLDQQEMPQAKTSLKTPLK